MRADQGSIFAGTLMEEDAQTRLRHILEAENAPSEDSENFEKLKAVYNACLDESAVSKRGSEPLEKMLAKLEDIYSLSSVSVKDGLTDAVLYLMKSGVEALAAPFPSVSALSLLTMKFSDYLA